MAKSTKSRSTVETRANTEARRRYGRTVIALRTTGTARLSGYFQAYRSDRRLNCLVSVGEPWHQI